MDKPLATLTTANPSYSPRFHELDGLRAFACILVVLHHTCTSAASRFLSEYSPVGAKLLSFTTASGVECFFCLSGFILLYPYVRCGKRLRLADYTISRVRRIYPPFIVAWFFAGIAQVVVTAFPTWYSNDFAAFSMRDWLCQLNLMTLLACDPTYNSAWWSLSVECVWYVLVPVLVWASSKTPAFRGSFTWMLWTTASIAAVWYCESPAFGSANHQSGITEAVSRFVAFASCFTSAVWLLVYSAGIRTLAVAGSIGLVLIAHCVVTGDFRLIHPGFGLSWAVVIGLCMRLDGLRSIASQPILIWLGERSYSLFLTHMTVFVLTNWAVSFWCPARTMTYGIVSRLWGLPLSLFVAMLLFWFVERHFSHRMETADLFWPPLR